MIFSSKKFVNGLDKKPKKLDKNVLLETNVEEERRLLYVAMTRVEERLYI